jgi:NADH:ubiquinone oxidoreductase subunit F (NADH-binding)
VANGDEGDPGSWIDRLLLERAPHSVLAGIQACGRVIGAKQGVVYIRGEYPAAAAAMEKAIQESENSEMRIFVVRGHGAYVVGEETALLAAIEGQRGEPRPKPPYPAEVGLFGKPTVVQNVETLSLIPALVGNGKGSRNKAICLSGAGIQGTLAEIELGTPLSVLLARFPAYPWTFALIGGPLGRVLPASAFDTPLDFDTLPGLGHGGIVLFDQSTTPAMLYRHLAEFACAESCGSCTPCRVGSARLLQPPEKLERLLSTMEMGSLCGFGQGVPRPIRDLIQAFGREAL